MNESGDQASQHFPENSDRTLIAKLLTISDAAEDEAECRVDNLCGWEPIKVSSDISKKTPEKSEAKTSNSLKKSVRGNNALQWKEVVHLDAVQKTKKTDNAPQTKKKRPKFHEKRIEELSLPRKKREKVGTSTREKTLFPSNNHIKLNPELYYSNKMAMTRIALQYGSSGPELRRLSQSNEFFYGDRRSEISRSAHERQDTGKSIRELLSKNQPHSAGLAAKGKGISHFLPSILVKTRANVDNNWDNEDEDDVIDETWAESSVSSVEQNLNLPRPHANLTNGKTGKKNGKSDCFSHACLPPIGVRSQKHKRALGSVTAITQGNIKAGIKTNSIKKIRRQALPQTSVILPKLSGSRVEVPLLPQSPDFLHRLL